MPKTIVRCSYPGCKQVATAKIARPWVYNRFSELKTYGFSCPEHIDDVLETAKNRPAPQHLTEGEKLGEYRNYDLEAY